MHLRVKPLILRSPVICATTEGCAGVYFKNGIIFDSNRTKNKVMKAIFAALTLGLLFSCGSTKVKGNGEGQTLKMKAMSSKAQLGKMPVDTDALNIESAKISGNTLILAVTYTGGCADHTFDLVGSMAISKSLPPIRAVKIIHNSNGDTCKATVKKTLNFDLTELAYKKEAGSEIILNIEGVSEPMRWVYKK